MLYHLAIVATALAGPLLIDADRQLPAPQARSFEAGLAALGKHRAVVVLMRKGPRDGVEAIAEGTFRSRKLDRDDMCIAVDVQGRQVAAHVGQDLTNRGLDRAAIKAVIGRTFKEPARAGKYDVAALALAQGLTTYRAPAAPVAHTGTRTHHGGGQSPWWSIAALALLGFIAWGVVTVVRLLRGGPRGSGSVRRAKSHGITRSGHYGQEVASGSWFSVSVDSGSSSCDDDADRWSSASSGSDWSSSSSSDSSSSSSSDSGGSTGSDSW